MTLKELKIWITQLPPDLDNYDVIIRDWKILDEQYDAALDKPIVTCYVDEKTNEVCFLDDISSKNFDTINEKN